RTSARKADSSCRPSRRGVDRNTVAAPPPPAPYRSPLTQGRGSKRLNSAVTDAPAGSPLTQGRGSKQVVVDALLRGQTSPLTQGRGSKHRHDRRADPGLPSPLTQGRGSKRDAAQHLKRVVGGRPSRRGVDRNQQGNRAAGLDDPSPLTQ